MEKQKETTDLKDQIIDVLKACYDPEIPASLYDMGLIYDIDIDDENNIHIKMTLTSPACPVAGSLPGEVEIKVSQLKEVKTAKVEVVWEPIWNPDMMSDAARYQLGML